MFKNILNKVRNSVAVLSLLFATITMAATSQEFCWIDSYGRGVGTIPTSCEGGKEYDAGLCYQKCNDGYYGVGPVCWSRCPSGYIDMGAICHIDKKLVVTGSIRCTARDWFGTCWWSVTDCPPDYGNGFAGLCSLNTPSVPNGMSGSALDPMKGTYGRGVGTIPTSCPGGQYDAGLCYKNCNSGYKGVGPVCWNTCPSGKAACGAGCATSSSVCTDVILNQVSSTVSLAVTVATLGESGVVTSEASSALSKLRSQWSIFKQTEQGATMIKAAKTANNLRILESVVSAPSDQEALRRAANMDPTGVVATVGAYLYPVCNH